MTPQRIGFLHPGDMGISVAATSTWWFGWFDRPPKPSAR